MIAHLGRFSMGRMGMNVVSGLRLWTSILGVGTDHNHNHVWAAPPTSIIAGCTSLSPE